MLKVTIAKIKDAQEIINVLKSSWLDTYPNEELGIKYSDIEKKVDSFSSVGIIKHLNDPDTRYWVAKIGTMVVGMIKVTKYLDKNSIEALYILPEYQGMGAGKALLKHGLLWLGRDKNITLGVATYNQGAINFYKKFGFVLGSVRKDSVAQLQSGKFIPEIEMILYSR